MKNQNKLGLSSLETDFLQDGIRSEFDMSTFDKKHLAVNVARAAGRNELADELQEKIDYVLDESNKSLNHLFGDLKPIIEDLKI